MDEVAYSSNEFYPIDSHQLLKEKYGHFLINKKPKTFEQYFKFREDSVDDMPESLSNSLNTAS